MNLLDEIRTDLVNESVSLPNTLRKAKILASAIGIAEFREWLDFELGGYPDGDRVPEYRRFRPTNLGTFSGPYNSGVKDVVLPTYNLPDSVRDFAENLIVFDGVGALEAQALSSYQKKWPQEMVMLARDSMQMSGGMVLVDAYQPVSGHIISGILDQVKNKLLDFILGLEESNVTSDDLDNRAVEPEVARNLFNINIYGDRNVVAGGEQVSQNVKTVQEGDIESLINALRELNIHDEDLNELKNVVSAEPSDSGGEYGPKVQAWLGKMISRAATGTWNIGLETAPKLLTKALNSFYGI